MRILILLAALVSVAAAQETRHEVTQSAGAADAKPNDPKVPDVVSIPSQFERVVILASNIRPNCSPRWSAPSRKTRFRTE
jgi:hypothetical protein